MSRPGTPAPHVPARYGFGETPELNSTSSVMSTMSSTAVTLQMAFLRALALCTAYFAT